VQIKIAEKKHIKLREKSEFKPKLGEIARKEAPTFGGKTCAEFFAGASL